MTKEYPHQKLVGMVKFDSQGHALQAAASRKGSTWGPEAQAVVLRPVPSTQMEGTNLPIQAGLKLEAHSPRSGSTGPSTPRLHGLSGLPQPLTPQLTPRGGASTPRGGGSTGNLTPRMISPRNQSSREDKLSFRSSFAVLVAPSKATQMNPIQYAALRRAKHRLRHVAVKKIQAELEAAVVEAARLGISEEDEDYAECVQALRDQRNAAQTRSAVAASNRAYAKLMKAWPSNAEEHARMRSSTPPRQRIDALEKALKDSGKAVSLCSQSGLAGVGNKLGNSIRNVCQNWTVTAWSQLQGALVNKDLAALGPAVEECESILSALRAAGDSAVELDDNMRDELRAARRIVDGLSGFADEVLRTNSNAALRATLEPFESRSGVGMKFVGSKSRSALLQEALLHVEALGGRRGDTEDDCVGRAEDALEQLTKRCISRWGLFGSILCAQSAVSSSVDEAAERLNRAIDIARTSGMEEADLEPAFAAELRFEDNRRLARELREALEDPRHDKLKETALKARAAADKGAHLLLQTDLRMAYFWLAVPARKKEKKAGTGSPESDESQYEEDSFDEDELMQGSQANVRRQFSVMRRSWSQKSAVAEADEPDEDFHDKADDNINWDEDAWGSGPRAQEMSHLTAKKNLQDALQTGDGATIRAALAQGRRLGLDRFALEQAGHVLAEKELMQNIQQACQRQDAPALEAAIAAAERRGWDERVLIKYRQALKEVQSKVKVVRERLEAAMGSPISFEADSPNKLTDVGKQVVSNIAVILKEFPGIAIRIEGHSNINNSHRAKIMSQGRADAVKQALKEAGCTNWMTSKGWGCAHPEVKGKVVRVLPLLTPEDHTSFKQLRRPS
eukprot:TRINITY_DN26146_c0_g1_i1.p1 TRINITY_DN26146_c0_g1~~TRINITY_DN26146_c0_g1_i1.p1  ORF type:complete len:910 (-),score=217.39 TRINITY_DN26146_c0_g1_i1:50-2599(-)